MTDTTQDAPITKTRHTLPEAVVATFGRIENTTERDNYIVALRAQRWTLESIAVAAQLTRERVRQIAKLGSEGDGKAEAVRQIQREEFPLPTPPLRPVKTKRVLRQPSEASLARMLELQELAERHRANSSEEVKQASEEYTGLIDYVNKEEDVSLSRIAIALGRTHSALRFRLTRYGYRNVGSWLFALGLRWC